MWSVWSAGWVRPGKGRIAPVQLKLGWMYEYAHCDEQRYKEQRVILEQKLVVLMDGVCDPEYGYSGPYPTTLPDNSDTPV